MGLKTGDLLVTELVRRITNLDRVTALAAINRAQQWVVRQGSFTFMMNPLPATLSATFDATTGAQAAKYQVSLPMDSGKAKMMFNLDGSPIQHIPWSDFWQSSNFNLPVSTMYDCYTIKTQFAASAPVQTFFFMPNQSGQAILYYHNILGSIADDASNFSELPNDFDDLLIDLAEAEERRIYDVGDSWQLLLARSQDQIKVLLDGYRSETQQPTGLQDAQTKIQETTAIGRA